MATSKRGFASMDMDKQRSIASKGGKAAHIKGTAHEWSSEEARAAGRKGGESRGSRTRVNGDESAPTSTFTAGGDWLSQAGSSLRTSDEYSNTNANRSSSTPQYTSAAPANQNGFLVDSRAN